MVKVNYGALQTMSSTTSSASQARVAGYQQLINAFSTFSGSYELQGDGYDAARTYASGIMVSYYQACIIYSEAVADAADYLADTYTALCGSESLDEEELQTEINNATRGSMQVSSSIASFERRDKLTDTQKASLESLRIQASELDEQIRVATEKLEHLKAFDAASASACTAANDAAATIASAEHTLGVSFAARTFECTTSTDWATTVATKWEARAVNLQESYDKALQKLYNGEELTESDLTAIERYNSEYPGVVDQEILQYTKEVRQVKADEMKYRSLVDKLDSGKELTNEEIRTIEDKKESYPNVQVNTTTLNKIVAKRAYEKVQDKIKNNQTLTDKDKEIMSRYWRIYPGEERKEFNRLKKKVHSEEFFKIGQEGYTSEELLFIANYISNHPNEIEKLDDDINYGIVMTQAYSRYHSHGDNPDYFPFNAGTGIYHDIINKTGRYPNGEEADGFNKWFAKNDGMKYLTITQETLNLYNTIYGAHDMSKEAYKNGVSPNYTQNNGLLNYVDYLEINQSAKENPNEPEVNELLDSLEYLED
ncbi:hypothetical protein QM351_07730 [Streptococcus parasanguinis]|jgi:hypothetical protein|uniref:hypothetical protein n=1 Tax=Streptococcus parasanguinis TaxID=1318 RepID=UPI0039C0FB3D